MTTTLIAVEAGTNLAVYRGHLLALNAEGLRTGTLLDPSLTPDNCTLHPCPELPGPWLGRAYRLEDGALVLTPEGAAELEKIAAEQAAPAGEIMQDTRVTKLAFRNRFTQAEKVAMEIAGLDNPAAPMAQRAQSAALRANVADLAAATFIDLQRPDTRAGVQMLEAAGLLAPGRALVILDAPIQAEERPL